MKHRLNIISLFTVAMLILSSCKEEPRRELIERMELNTNWIFRNSSEPNWYPANVPGTVHTDLRNNGVIENPFYGCNEEKLQWIGERDWIYKNQFTVDSNLLANKNINLVFEGLDTYANVMLNGQTILQANNMHRRWEFDCKDQLKVGNNLLEIHFQSALNKFFEDSLALGYPLPGGRWNFARKAAYHFGWDWGPRFITAGIHKPVYLETWNTHRPTDFHIYTKNIDQQAATIGLTYWVESAIDETATIRIIDTKTNKELTNQTCLLGRQAINLQSANQNYRIEFSIDNPKLWWSNGLGEPHIYDLHIELITESGYIHTKEIPFGVRTLKTFLEDDEHGQALYVELNGHKVYMKGANYIPQHSFITEVTHKNYKDIVDLAVESNMNMLRVWGGGVYEDDIFYELCNRNGILVWQDFMFACAMYPGNDDYVENVKQEAIQQVKRLRNHSNIALWCGNNEVDEGWHNWGWQKAHNISKRDSTSIWEGYKKVFHQVLPDAVKEHDPQRFYLSTSPLYGWGWEKSLTHGSSHYWGVWWGVQPAETYIEKVPRFASEFGLQAMPTLSTIRTFQTEDEDYLFSPTLQCHQKHPTGYQTIDSYLKMEGLYAETLDEFIYLSQLVQAKGIGLAIEAQRSAMPYCMGTLYWQLNDCWPVTSWSATDVFGSWKALQYRVRELYSDILVSAIDYNNQFEIHLVSDKLEDTEGVLEIFVIDFDGNIKTLFSKEISAKANTSTSVVSEKTDLFFADIDKERVMLEAKFTDSNGKQYVNRKFLVPLGMFELPTAAIETRFEEVKGGFNIRLTSNTFAAHVQLYLTESHAKFSDNFIHILPNENVTVFCKTDLSIERFKEQLRIMHL
jgi:beta-mannosidase